MKTHPMRHSLGFTLIEVVITLLLLGVLSAFIARPLISLIQTRTGVSDAAEQRSEIEHALSRMAKEIRLSDDSTDISESECGPDLFVLDTEGNERLYERNGNDELMLNGNVLVSDARLFECRALNPTSLRLYKLTLNDFQVRIFKRDG